MRQIGSKKLLFCTFFRRDVVKRAVDVDEKKFLISLISSDISVQHAGMLRVQKS